MCATTITTTPLMETEMVAVARVKPGGVANVNFNVPLELAERLAAYRLANTSGLAPSRARIMVLALTRFLEAEGYGK